MSLKFLGNTSVWSSLGILHVSVVLGFIRHLWSVKVFLCTDRKAKKIIMYVFLFLRWHIAIYLSKWPCDCSFPTQHHLYLHNLQPKFLIAGENITVTIPFWLRAYYFFKIQILRYLRYYFTILVILGLYNNRYLND